MVTFAARFSGLVQFSVMVFSDLSPDFGSLPVKESELIKFLEWLVEEYRLADVVDLPYYPGLNKIVENYLVSRSVDVK
jgi:hypothetical protein